jgi:acyl carrier protein phosphodiesterase
VELLVRVEAPEVRVEAPETEKMAVLASITIAKAATTSRLLCEKDTIANALSLVGWAIRLRRPPVMFQPSFSPMASRRARAGALRSVLIYCSAENYTGLSYTMKRYYPGVGWTFVCLAF